MAGLFLTLEGGEGVGKSTQTLKLAEWLEGLGHRVLTTREPGGSPGAEAIRTLLVEGSADRWDALSEALLLTVARRNHLQRTILPALSSGTTVVCDRYIDSMLVYQGYMQSLEEKALMEMHQRFAGGYMPNLTLLLDLDADVALERALSVAGQEKRFESLGLDWHRRLRTGFLNRAKGEPDRFITVDASGESADVFDRLKEALAPHLNHR